MASARASGAPVQQHHGPWSLSTAPSRLLIIEVVLIPYPSGKIKMQLQLVPVSYAYPDTITGIRIFRKLSPGDMHTHSHRVVSNKLTSSYEYALDFGYKNIPVNIGGAPKVPDSGK